MTLFNWFFRKSNAAPPARGSDGGERNGGGRTPPPERDIDPVNRAETRKARRHARREQLYVAVRESMTRAGVLASSFKFKVLSLDQHGNQFLVMVDVAPVLGRQPEKLAEIEGLITRTASARFEICVTAVYWRMDPGAAAAIVKAAARKASEAPAMVGAPAMPPIMQPPGMPRYEPIQDDEVAAFKQALAAASGNHRATLDSSGKSRTGLHSYTLLTGFEDTEATESGAAPALSTTQYGDLN